MKCCFVPPARHTLGNERHKDKFIRRNADPIWLHQNEIWEMLQERETVGEIEVQEESNPDDIPF